MEVHIPIQAQTLPLNPLPHSHPPPPPPLPPPNQWPQSGGLCLVLGWLKKKKFKTEVPCATGWCRLETPQQRKLNRLEKFCRNFADVSPCLQWCTFTFHSLHELFTHTLCEQYSYNKMEHTFACEISIRRSKLASRLACYIISFFMHMTCQVCRQHFFFSSESKVWAHFVRNFMIFNWCVQRAHRFLWDSLDIWQVTG